MLALKRQRETTPTDAPSSSAQSESQTNDSEANTTIQLLDHPPPSSSSDTRSSSEESNGSTVTTCEGDHTLEHTLELSDWPYITCKCNWEDSCKGGIEIEKGMYEADPDRIKARKNARPWFAVCDIVGCDRKLKWEKCPDPEKREKNTVYIEDREEVEGLGGEMVKMPSIFPALQCPADTRFQDEKHKQRCDAVICRVCIDKNPEIFANHKVWRRISGIPWDRTSWGVVRAEEEVVVIPFLI